MLRVLTTAPAGSVYWQSEGGFSISTSYLSTNGNLSDASAGGIATDAAGSSATTQLAYAADSWGIAGAYTYASGDNGVGLYTGNATVGAACLASGCADDGEGVLIAPDSPTNSYGVSAWWMPEESGWIPSISAGWGLTQVFDTTSAFVDDAVIQSWYVGLEWDDVFVAGNSLGVAGGQSSFITDLDDEDGNDIFTAGGGFVWELFYKFQVTDNISITPAVHYFSKPFPNASGLGDLDAVSGIIKTQFKF